MKCLRLKHINYSESVITYEPRNIFCFESIYSTAFRKVFEVENLFLKKVIFASFNDGLNNPDILCKKMLLVKKFE